MILKLCAAASFSYVRYTCLENRMSDCFRHRDAMRYAVYLFGLSLDSSLEILTWILHFIEQSARVKMRYMMTH